MQEISFTSGKHTLVGRIFRQGDVEKARRGVLFVHGQGSSQEAYEHRARMISGSLEAVCLTFDLSGHGREAADFGKYSVYDHLQDVLAACDYLASFSDVDRGRLGICGASYGAYLAALVTATRAVKRLVLRAPSLAKDVRFSTPRGQPPIAEEVPEGFDSLKVLRRYSGEVLIVESENDEVIPKYYITAYMEACSHAEHLLIPEATHALTNPSWDARFVTAIKDWFTGL
jgi:pimeloyl-ACP methyl ester carboxylesterase